MDVSDSMVDDDDDDDLTELSRDTDQLQTTSTDMDSNVSTTHTDSDKIDSQLIKKILNEMKTEFTRATPSKVNNNSDGSANENDNDNDEIVDDPKPVAENFHRIKVSDLISLKKFEVSDGENVDVEEWKTRRDKTARKINANADCGSSNEEHEKGSEEISVQEDENKSDCDRKNQNDSNNQEKFDKLNDNPVDGIKDTSDTIDSSIVNCTETIANLETSFELPKCMNDSNVKKMPSPKKVNERKPVHNEEDVVNEPRRKRSLRNQALVNKEIEEEHSKGLKRSSRRFSKEYKRESVLQNAIARKEKSFSSLGSSDDRSYRRGQRSPRQSNISSSSNSNNNCSNNINTGSNIVNDIKNVVVKSNNSSNKNNKSPKSNISPTSSTTSLENIVKSNKLPKYNTSLPALSLSVEKNKSPKFNATLPSSSSISIENSSNNKNKSQKSGLVSPSSSVLCVDNNNKSHKAPKGNATSPTSPESSSGIIKSPQYDEKLQSTIDHLKSTLEHGSCSNSSSSIIKKITKLDYNDISSSILVNEKSQLQKDYVDTTPLVTNKKENSIKLNNVVLSENLDSEINDDSSSSSKKYWSRPPKRKTRYFKGLKYTFKGGHVKNSNRTWSMTRRKKYEYDRLVAKEKKTNSVEKDEGEVSDDIVTNVNKTDKANEKKSRSVNCVRTIEDVHDPIRLSSIFGIDVPESVIGNTVSVEETKEAISAVVEVSKISITDNSNSSNCGIFNKVKRKLDLGSSDKEDDEVSEKKKRDGCESPSAGEVAPQTQENPDVPALSAVASITADPVKGIEPLKLSCFCNATEQNFASPSCCRSEFYCQAIDSLDNRLIGCCNTVNVSAARLVRASVKLPYLVLCDVHHQRILRHNCCPGCGSFCTQGRFVQCKYGHHYHKDCHLTNQLPAVTNSPSKEDKQLNKEGKYEEDGDKQDAFCLHCGSGSVYEVNISLGAHKYPVFLPLQKPPKQVPSAKMTFGGCSVEPYEVEMDHLCIEDKKYLVDDEGNKPLVPATSLVLPSGLKITSEGLPDAGLKDKLDKLLHVACTVTTPPSGRYTLRNMYHAAKSGDAEKLIYMLASGLNPNHQFREWVMGTALHAACYSGHMTVVHLLIQAGSDIDILDKEQNTPLMISVLNRHNDIVKYLVKIGADVTFKGGDGMTALHLAAKSGNLEACHYLLSNFNVPRFFIDTVDDGRWTPLVWAAEHCHTEVVRFLLLKRADPLVRDAEQNIALHWAALAGCVEISEALLNYGSEINSTNAHGDTALHIAARQNAYSCTVLLLSRGSRVDLRNRAGFSALESCLVPDSPTYNAIKLNVELRNFSNSRRISRILTNDITRGHEVNPIQCVNAYDDEGFPQDFTYINENCFTSNISVDRTITSLQFCKCRDSCTTGCCMCGKISVRCWYDNDGKLLPEFNFADPPMLFECNRACLCNKVTCKNRVVQHGIRARFQLFKTTTNKGWGVRTLRLIPKGNYVCEYIGEIISDCEADVREDDSYLFDLDNRDGETYCIDARKYGNIARFINHMCVPNLLPVRVFIDHQDLHFPRIAFFANRDIQANEELGFDYGEKFWIIKCKSFTCTCGAEKCRYSETSIQQTLENYKQKLQQEDNSSTQ